MLKIHFKKSTTTALLKNRAVYWNIPPEEVFLAKAKEIILQLERIKINQALKQGKQTITL